MRLPKAFPAWPVLAVLGAGVALAGCGSSSDASGQTSAAVGDAIASSTPGSTPVRGGSLAVSISLGASDLDPENVQADGDAWADLEIFDHPYEYAPGSLDPVPGVVSSYTVSGDGLTYTLHVRSGVRFSNGDPLTASDVAFTLERAANQSLNIADPICCYTYKRIEAANPTTVVLTLSRATPTVPDYFPTFGIVDKKYLERVGESYFKTHPIGSGPFMVKSFTPNGVLQLVRNPYYWRAGQPYLNGVTITPVTDSNTRVLSVTTGQADVADQVPYSEAGSLQAAGGTRLIAFPFSGDAYIFMNEEYAPLKDTAVRRALSYATPRSQIIDAVFHGFAKIANTDAMPAGDYSAAVQQLPYDLTAARAELAKSGYPHGFSIQISEVAGDPTSDLMATIEQSSWAKIGVHATIVSLESGTFSSNWVNGKYQALSLPIADFFSDIAQPDELLEGYVAPSSPFHGWFTYYDSATAAALFEKGLATPSEPAHRKLMLQLQELSITDPPVLTIAFPKLLTLVRSNVCGFDPVENGSVPYRLVYLAPKC